MSRPALRCNGDTWTTVIIVGSLIAAFVIALDWVFG